MSTVQVLTHSLAGFAHSNQVLERLFVMHILHLSWVFGLWMVSTSSKIIEATCHMIWSPLQILQLKCGNPSKIHLITVLWKNRYMCIQNNSKYYLDPFSHTWHWRNPCCWNKTYVFHYNTLELRLCKPFSILITEKCYNTYRYFLHILHSYFCIKGHITHFSYHLRNNPHNSAMTKHSHVCSKIMLDSIAW